MLKSLMATKRTMTMTKKVKVTEATDRQLSWLVGVAEGYEMSLYGVDPSIRAWERGLGVKAPWMPTRYWSQMGPIIEREKVATDYDHDIWNAAMYGRSWYICGETLLIAAARCYVASKFGDEVEVPEELS